MTDMQRLESFLSEDARRFMMEAPGPFMPVVEDVYRIGTARKWFVVYTNPKCEAKAAEGMRAKSFDAYVPISAEWRWPSPIAKKRGAKRSRVEKPLLTRYVFVRMPVFDRRAPFGAVRAIDGVREFVGTPDGPLVILDGLIEALRDREAIGEFDKTATHKLHGREVVTPKWVDVGREVVIKDGALGGFFAIIQKILPQERIEVQAYVFGRASRVTLDIAQVREPRYIPNQIRP